MQHLTCLHSWRELERHQRGVSLLHMRDLFDADPARFDKFSIHYPGMLLDYSKNRITERTMGLLFALAREVGIEHWLSGTLSGDKSGAMKNREVLYAALHNRSEACSTPQKRQVRSISSAIDKLQTIAETISNGEWRGFTGKRITDVVYIATASTCLGLQLVTEALQHDAGTRPTIHYLSNQSTRFLFNE